MLLETIDRRFFREHYDARRILLTLASGSGHARNLPELATLVAAEVDRALHLQHVGLSIQDPEGAVLRDPQQHLPPLSTDSPLAALLAGSAAPLDVSLEPDSPSALARLPSGDRQWLEDTHAQLLVPLRAPTGSLLGVMTLGHKRSELPFNADDRQLLTAVAASVALVIDRRLLGGSGEAVTEGDAPPTTSLRRRSASAAGACTRAARRNAVDAAATCATRCCRRTWPASSPSIAASAPAAWASSTRATTSRSIARWRSRRCRACRPARPRSCGARRARWRRWNTRTWRPSTGPRRGEARRCWCWSICPAARWPIASRPAPIPIAHVVIAGRAIAQALRHLHGLGILHRDVKPSNIGYAAGDVPKLMDFGLAKLTAAQMISPVMHDRLSDLSTQPVSMAGPGEALSTGRQFVGTTPYMSPEVLNGHRPSEASDLWSLCVSLYEALTRRHPFLREDLATTVTAITAGLTVDARIDPAGLPARVERAAVVGAVGDDGGPAEGHRRVPRGARWSAARLAAGLGATL